MAVRLSIGGQPYLAENFSVQEAATPLAGGDTTGQVGTLNFSIRRPDRDLFPTHPLNATGSITLIDESVRLEDDRNGVTVGRVSSVKDTSGSLIELECVSRLGELNVFNIQAQPFVGTLQAAFTYYLSLGGITTNLSVDTSIASRSVVFPGWNGELWFHLKQMAAAQQCDISLVSGVVLLRPTRTRTATANRDVERSRQVSYASLAQSVEVYQYDNRAITNELVYPPGGWTPEVEVITVAAGETIEQEIELSASVSSIVQPTMQTFVSQDERSTSVYTIVADDGFPVSPALWASRGGRLSVRINPETTTLTVTLTGATDIITDTGEYSKNFSVALASDTSGNRYSTLRILGTGVAYSKEKLVFRTGLTPQQTATAVGLTIDNPFLTNRNQLYALGTRAARMFSGQVPSIAGSVIAINQSGDSGSAAYPTYGTVQSTLNSPSTKTYAQVAASAGYVGNTYGQVKQYWFDTVRSEFANQVFGNVAGVRVWDSASKRFYRIRNGTINPGRIEFSDAEDDLVYSDVQPKYAPFTYAQVKAFNTGLTYKKSNLAGLIGVT